MGYSLLIHRQKGSSAKIDTCSHRSCQSKHFTRINWLTWFSSYSLQVLIQKNLIKGCKKLFVCLFVCMYINKFGTCYGRIQLWWVLGIKLWWSCRDRHVHPKVKDGVAFPNFFWLKKSIFLNKKFYFLKITINTSLANWCF